MKEAEKNNSAAWWQPAVMMFVKLSGWIAGPIIIALYLGKWLDKKYNSSPRLLIICIGIAFFVSMIGLTKEAVREYKKIDRLGKSGKTEKE
ncbi:AtpZ/AtpI family protein [Candidatus Falkowbacteria bacterium]|nr:AtpZ/AtpI family protein [Candidatus Falkowbacteria bacterium]